MKKLLSIAALAACLLPANAQDTNYKISGTVPDDVKTVYLYVAAQRAAYDSVAVNAGKFEFNGTKPLNELLIVRVNNDGVVVFNDGTSVELNAAANTLEGSELNKKLYGYNRQLSRFDDEIGRIYAEYATVEKDQSEAGRAKAKELENRFNTIQEQMLDEQVEIIKANKDNLIPAALLGNIYYMLDYDELKEFMPETAPYYNHPAVARVKRQIAALEKRMPGKMFMDLTMNDTEGTPRKLSEWCGKGNYVLIDFWASWCGPCRQEMPNVVENYKKYHSKGFEIVGVSFDSKAEAWKSAIEKLGMNWPNISDLKGWQSEGASVYGIMSIPSNVLLDGEGKIVAVDLRAEALGEKLKEVYGF